MKLSSTPKNEKMKLPNHYGSVTKLSGKRRKPWMAREGVSGSQKVVGYAATKKEALILLSKYNMQPWNLDTVNITFKGVYESWLKDKCCTLSNSNQKSLKSAYKYCAQLDNMKYCQIKAYHMQKCLDGCPYETSRVHIKALLTHLDKYAIAMDVITHGYANLLSMKNPAPKKQKIPFSDSEIEKLWENINIPWVDSILFFVYTGFRITEMLLLKTENVYLEDGYIVGGIKTQAGKNRIVPIHSKIYPIVENRFYNSQGGYLFELNGKKITESSYRIIWRKVMADLQLAHTPHECRHTLRSKMDSAGANKVCIDRILGHKSQDVGEDVYTHKTLEELKEAMEKVVYHS